MKEYKSNEELIDYLASKNVIIKNRKSAIKKINKYTYYSVVNSYKNVFKSKDNKYIDNVSFDEIYSLYEFDKNIKIIFLKYSLEVENVIKSLMANQISKVYGIKDYLNVNNFDQSISIEKWQALINKINNEVNKDYKSHSAITHYIDRYNFIPPFVLTKILTFGVASSYYGILKQSDRQAISKQFKISDKMLKQILKNLTTIRNISAHSDRLYNYTSKFYLSFNLIDNMYKTPNNITNLYMVIRCMEVLLDKRKYRSFQSELNKEIKKLSKKIKSININVILKIMGYPV